MPISIKYDPIKKKSYVQYGKVGQRYYFITGSDRSYQIAYSKAQRQASAIHVSSSEASNKDKPKKVLSGSKTARKSKGKPKVEPKKDTSGSFWG